MRSTHGIFPGRWQSFMSARSERVARHRCSAHLFQEPLGSDSESQMEQEVRHNNQLKTRASARLPNSLPERNRVPEPQRGVSGTRNEASAVRAESDRMDIVEMAVQLGNFLLRRDIPEANRIVRASAREPHTVRSECK